MRLVSFALACSIASCGDDGASKPSTSTNTNGSNPGKVTCESAECDVASGSACCWRDTRTCMAGCPSSSSFELHCDEAADCTDGANAKCCLNGMATQCNGACASGVQLCKTQAECGDAGCALKTCAGRSLQVCGTPPGCQ